MSYGTRGGSNYGNQRRRSSRGLGRKTSSQHEAEADGLTSNYLKAAWSRSPGSGLFEAKEDVYGGYWTVIFKPDGHYMGRYSKNEAIRRAAEKNHNFLTTSPYVGLEIGNYDADGKLVQKHKIIGVYENNPDLISGAIQALLDDGHEITMQREYFDKKLSEQRK